MKSGTVWNLKFGPGYKVTMLLERSPKSPRPDPWEAVGILCIKMTTIFILIQILSSL